MKTKTLKIKIPKGYVPQKTITTSRGKQLYLEVELYPGTWKDLVMKMLKEAEEL